MKQLTLGYSPFDAPTGLEKIFPFDSLFDFGINLMLPTNRVEHCDAVLLWGGSDISPSIYNEPKHYNSGPETPSGRDLFEWELLRLAFQHNKPIIGVCRGAQLLCAFAGGKLIQNVNGHHHDHLITCNDGKEFYVSSSHHQMMYPYDVKHELLAWSKQHMSRIYEPEDKYYSIDLEQRRVKEPEVVFFPEVCGMAIQCHPEWHQKDSPFNEWIINSIIDRCFK